MALNGVHNPGPTASGNGAPGGVAQSKPKTSKSDCGCKELKTPDLHYLINSRNSQWPQSKHITVPNVRQAQFPFLQDYN